MALRKIQRDHNALQALASDLSESIILAGGPEGYDQMARDLYDHGWRKVESDQQAIDAAALVAVDEVVRRLEEMDAYDYEKAHADADELILSLVDDRVREAYEHLASRAKNWPAA